MSTLNFNKIILSIADLFFVSKLKTALEAQRCTVRLAPHETEIQEAINIDPPHLIILDLENSQHDPRVIVQTIRKNEKTKDLPILAFTNHIKLPDWEKTLDDPKTVVVSNSFISSHISDVVGLKLLFDKKKDKPLENE